MTESDAASSPRVLIVSARVGAGHREAALAVMDALQAADPCLPVRHEDAMEHVSGFFRHYYQGGFVLSVTRLPWMYGVGYRITDAPDKPRRRLSERLRLAFERLWMKALAERIVQWRPEVVVCTHFVAAPVVAGLLASGRLKARMGVVVTDHVAHRWWYCEGADRWFVPDEESVERLQRWAIPAERIALSGIPVRRKWTRPLDQAKARADWRLAAEGPIVVLSGGTEFVCGPVVALAQGILAACPQSHVVVMAGRNKDLLASLSQSPEAGRRLTPVSFTDRANELVGTCSLMVTKPGGVTTAECCAVGTPMVLLRPVPGQEACNAEYLSSHGAAVTPGGPAEVVEAVRRLLADPAELARMAERARGLHRPGAETVANWILGCLKA